MTLPNLDAAAAAAFSWLLTYAIHSTLLLGAAALAAWRLADALRGSIRSGRAP